MLVWAGAWLLRIEVCQFRAIELDIFGSNSFRKLPRQVDNPKVEDLAFANASAGISPPRLSWSRSSLSTGMPRPAGAGVCWRA